MVDHARPFVEIEFPASARRAFAWLDTGGGPFIVGDSLGRDLGVDPVQREIDGQKVDVVDLPEVRVGGAPLDVTDCFARRSGSDLIREGFRADAFIPAHVLARHEVVFDYPGRTFSVDAGTDPLGNRGPVVSQSRPGWPAVTVSIAGESVNLLLDTGASCCMLSERLVERLGSKVAKRTQGAFGLANMSGGPWEARVETLRLPDFVWGEMHLASVIAVTRPEGNFEGMMSSGTTIPVEGAIAGNVLRNMRLEWRSSEQAAWIDAQPVGDEVLCQAPLILHSFDGEVRVVGASDHPSVRDVRPGDVLLAVDDIPIDATNFGAAVEMLGGSPGERRILRLRRDGLEFDVEAEVVDVV